MAEQPVCLKGSKILVVDDTPANIGILADFLEADGYSVSFATNGEKAIRLTNLDRPALILLDVMMPVMDGFETCRRLKADPLVADIPVIFVTGKTQAKDIAAAFEAGGVDYITKPIRQEEVSARVRTHLELRALISQRDALIAKLQEQNEAIRVISQQDPLTKLANRRYFTDELSRLWSQGLEQGSEVAIIMFDIDYFKYYNDRYGHQQGDNCIKAVAQVLESSFAQLTGLVARYGGEEFIAILPHCDLQSAKELAQVICIKVEAMQLPHEQSPTAKVVTTSVGVACCVPSEQATPDCLIKRADEALYQAKEAGRNQVFGVCLS